MKIIKLFIYSLLFLLLSCNKTDKNPDQNKEALENISSTQQHDDWEENFSSYEVDANLTSDRKMQIKVLKKEMGLKMKQIGMDPRLSGYQKGIEKRKLKAEYLNKINTILQGGNLSSSNLSSNTPNPQLSLQYKKIQEIEMQIKKLEYNYELQKDKLEMEEDILPKNVYKQRKNQLKLDYKQRKNQLKLKRDSIVLLNMNK